MFETGTQREVRNQRSELKIVLLSVFCILSSASVCSQSIISNYFNFFEGGTNYVQEIDLFGCYSFDAGY